MSQRDFAYRFVSLLLLTLSLAACATNGPPPIGSGAWHEQRIAEIQQAYDYGDITIDQYLALKNEADQIHVDYRERVRPQYQPRGAIVFGGPIVHHHHHRR